MKVVREMGPEDGSWTNTFMANDEAPFEIELTWNRGQVEPYDNGGKDTHIAFAVDDFDAFHELHEKMGCIIRENPPHGPVLHRRPRRPVDRDPSHAIRAPGASSGRQYERLDLAQIKWRPPYCPYASPGAHIRAACKSPDRSPTACSCARSCRGVWRSAGTWLPGRPRRWRHTRPHYPG